MKNSIIALIVVVISGIVIYNVAYYSSIETITIQVTDKERIVESDGDGGTTSKYLVFTQTETLENSDEFFMGKWNSSDIQGTLKQDSTYQVRVIGWRIPFLSMYRNVINVN